MRYTAKSNHDPPKYVNIFARASCLKEKLLIEFFLPVERPKQGHQIPDGH